MHTEPPPAHAPLVPSGWTAPRRAAAQAIAGPNDRRVAAAAARLLSMQDNAAEFAAWCDAHVAVPAPGAAS
jgi:hypothetical protein